MTSTRQLAAIMFTDIVGYTAMMGHDEKKAYELLRQNRLLQKPLIEKYGGMYIKELGDGTLASFPTVIDAVNCACLMIKGCESVEGLQLRIGIHLGDVIFENNDVFGDSVNIASRLQALAPPGGIWISESVHKNIANKEGIISSFISEETLKNVREPVRIYTVDTNSFHEETTSRLRPVLSQAARHTVNNKPALSTKKFIAIGLPVAMLAASALAFIPGMLKKQHARKELLPAIEKIVSENFRVPTSAFDMGLEAEKYIPNDSALINLWPKISTEASFVTDPPGAEVFWKDYQTPDAPWRSAGKTPLINIRLPRSLLRLEIRKDGFQTVYYTGSMIASAISLDSMNLKLDPLESLPKDMTRIPKAETYMFIVGLEQHGPKKVEEFLMDLHEVTNADYDQFIKKGGYTNKDYWTEPIFINGKPVPFEQVTSVFLDKTGRPGPATWEAGTYPDGQGQHPVTGVSWYEASAFANYAGKQLPTVFHWGVVAATARTEFIVPFSNFNGKGTVPVATLAGTSTYGLYDLAGNAREWCANSCRDGEHRYILGGGYNDPTYAFNDAYSQLASDRSVTNGFRCIKTLPADTIATSLYGEVTLAFRDYSKEKPVDDKTFDIYRAQFSYDDTTLDVKTEDTISFENWTVEKISFDAGYNKERMEAYVYLPKNVSPPFQPIIFYPGSQALFTEKFNVASVEGRIDFILKSGRALIHPVYKGTYERQDGIRSDLPESTVFYKDHVIMWRKDLGRTLDYLETRKDMQMDKVGYVGWSWGGFMGGIIPAIETRIKAIVLNVGGMCMTPSLPEVDQINFLPRIKQPVLMLNGKHDMYFPVETSQKPMFNFLGTAPEHKKLILYDVGHLVPRTDFVKESLAWFDKYLGTVSQ
jgi:class 3 adenylate cyclase/dienelactone hydrolase